MLGALATTTDTGDARPAVEFRAFYDAHFDYVWNTLRRLRVHAQDLRDQTQEVFITVHAIFDDYDPSRPPRPWLFAIAYRVSRRYFARLAKDRVEVHADLDLEAGKEPTPEEQLALGRDRWVIEQALSHVSPPLRAVFIMHDLDGFTVPDIAQALGIPVNTAYSRLRLAREAFASAVERLRRGKGST